jgi:hypothetical protein
VTNDLDLRLQLQRRPAAPWENRITDELRESKSHHRLNAIANSLMLVDKVTGALTVKTVVGAGNQHAIAFNPQEPGLIYHRYGSTGFETINIATDAVIAIGSAPSSGADQEQGMVWDPVNSVFRFGDASAWITLTTTGTRTDTGSTASAVYSGLAFDRTTTVPVELQSFSVE